MGKISLKKRAHIKKIVKWLQSLKNSKIHFHLLDRISDVAFDGNTCKTSASGSVNSTGLEPELLTRFELSSSGSTGDVIIFNLNFLRLQNSAVKFFFVYFAKVLLLSSLLSTANDKQNGTVKKYLWTMYSAALSRVKTIGRLG